jgi:zinc transport system substrate-binding protein
MQIARILNLFILSLGIALAGCDRSPPGPSGTGPATATPAVASADVITTFYPAEFFALRIAGGLVNVECPLPEYDDPIFWQPDGETIARYQSAKLVVINGAGYERWVATASLPLSRTCDLSRSFSSEFVKFKSTRHSHGGGGEHSHEGTDGHTWMDPNNAAKQVDTLLVAMSRRWPEHEKAFSDNAASLREELLKLDASFRELTPKLAGIKLIASHPAYNYIAKRYGWSIANVDLPPDAAPTPKQLQVLRGLLNGPSIILFEYDPGATVLAALATLDRLTPVVFRPGETIPPEDRIAGFDYLSIMNGNLARLGAAATKN